MKVERPTAFVLSTSEKGDRRVQNPRDTQLVQKDTHGLLTPGKKSRDCPEKALQKKRDALQSRKYARVAPSIRKTLVIQR